MKFQIGDEVTFMHWGSEGQLVGIISSRTAHSIRVKVGVRSYVLPANDEDLCLKVLFDSPLMKELS